MKILHTVEFYYPSTGGSQEVVRQLSERMVALGHEVIVATTKLIDRESTTHNGVTIVEFDISGNMVNGYQGDIAEYQSFLLREKFDVIMNYAAQQWATDLFLEVIDQIEARKIFVPCGFSGLKNSAYKDYFSKMPAWLRSYDVTVYLSDTYQDAIFAKEHNIKNMVVIPNGADEHEFHEMYTGVIRRELKIKGDKLIMHLGSFTGMKGQPEAMSIFAGSQLTDCSLVLVGNVLDKRTYYRALLKSIVFNLSPRNIKSKRRIFIKQLLRPQTVALLKSADAFLFPSNIEASPLVLFEACAAKTPFLTSDVGNAREIVEWTGGGVMLPTSRKEQGLTHVDIAASSQIVTSFMQDESLRVDLANKGFKAWSSRYTWAIITKEYLKIYGVKS